MAEPAKNQSRLISAYALLGFAAVLLYCAAWCFSSSQKKREQWTHAPARVVELEWKPWNRGGRKGRSFPHVRFETESGESCTVRTRESTRVVKCALGEQVEVLYPAGRPGEAVIYTFWSFYRWPLALALVGLNMVAFGGVLLICAKPDDPRVKALKAWFCGSE